MSTPATWSQQTTSPYSQGVWTPSLTTNGTAPTLTYSTRVGKYEKVVTGAPGTANYRSLITAHFYIVLSTLSSQGTGALIIDGLPFPATDLNTQAVDWRYYALGGFPLKQQVFGDISNGASYIGFNYFPTYNYIVGGGELNNPPILLDYTLITTNVAYFGTVTYRSDS